MSVPENINASPKSFVAALILVVLLGGLGVHRFYCIVLLVTTL